MKKVFAIILTLCLAVTQIVVVNATGQQQENVAPVIGNVSIESNQSEYTSADKVMLKVEATDDVQLGIAEYTISKVGENESLIIMDAVMSEQGYVNGFDIQNLDYAITSGTWKVTKVTVYDREGLSTEKDVSDLNLTFVVSNDITFDDKPIIKSVSVNSNNCKSDDVITYTMSLDANGLNIESVGISIENIKGNSVSLSFEKDKNDAEKYVASFTTESLDAYTRNIKALKIDIALENGAYYRYFPEGSPEIDWYTNLAITGVKPGDLDIVLIDVPEDTEPPVLVNYKYKKNTVFTPDYQEIEIKAKDNADLYCALIKWGTEGKDGNSDPSLTSSAYFISGEGSKTEAVSNMNFPRYMDNTTYYISEIILQDTSGNQSVYALSDDTLKKKEFEVINNNKKDILTSTSASDLVPKLETAPEGSVVVINIDEQIIGEDENGMSIFSAVVPKEAFEAIRGRDVTIIFENVYDDSTSSTSSDEGMQWIMNGKDINKEAKDIDVYFYMEEAVSDIWLKNQESKHGSKFPEFDWPRSSEEAISMNVPKLFREHLEKNGWGDLIHTLTIERVGKETIDETFMRLSNKDYVRFVFADNGELPGKSTIRMKPAYSMYLWMPDKNLNLYYYNEKADKFQLKQKGINKHSEGYYEFDIYHNSEYALADESFIEASTSNVSNVDKEQPDTGDDSNLLLPIIVGLIALALGSGVFATRKKYN